jgi:hypothetical protein
MSRLQLSRKSCETTIRRVSLAIGFLPFLAAMTSPPAPPRVCFPVQSTTIGRALPVNAAALAANSPPGSRRTSPRLHGMVRRAEQSELNHRARSSAPIARWQTARRRAAIELIVARNRWFEFISLQRGVSCERDSLVRARRLLVLTA